MKRLAFGTLMILLAFAVLAGGDASAAARKKKVKDSRDKLDKAYELDRVMKAPSEYLEREVFFYCRFASTAALFKPVNTPFNTYEFANFAVWPDKELIWTADGARNVLPTLYIRKTDNDLDAMLRMLGKYELIAVTGTVKNKYAGYPWILVSSIERVEMPKDRLCDATVQHMQSGSEALACGNGGSAARHFETALQFGLPPEYNARAYEQLAMSYLMIDNLPKAQEYLRLATEADRGDAVLHLALADVCLRMNEPEEAIAHCVFAIEKSGKAPQVYGMKGEAKAMMGDYIGAFADINVAFGSPGITPREKAMLEVRRARIYVRGGREADAARVYAAVTEPESALASESWLHNEVGLFYESLYLKTGDARYLDSAHSAYEQAASFGSSDPAVLYNQAEVEYRRQALSGFPNFEKVREILRRIEDVSPEYVPARVLTGRVMFHEGRADEADRLYHTFADRIGDDPMSLMALAEAYIDQGNADSASMLINRAMAVQPWNIRLKALGDSYLARGSGASRPANPGGQPLPAASAFESGRAQHFDPYAESPVYSLPLDEHAAGRREQVITVGPGDVIRIERASSAASPTGDFQTSVPPEPAPGVRAGSYPAGEVHLETIIPRPADGGAHYQAAPRPIGIPVERPLGVTPVDLGYYPPESPVAHTVSEEYEIGYAVSSQSALASVSTPAASKPHVPPPFSFNPDESPVIIAGHVSPSGEELAAMPVRNANLHRGIQKRRPAEIIEEDAKYLSPNGERAFAMAPPAATVGEGRLRRPPSAEVLLPTTTLGIGAGDRRSAPESDGSDPRPQGW